MIKEPVAITGAIQILISAVLGTLGAFDVWHPTDDQTTAIFALYVAVIGVGALIVRRKVTPNNT